MASTGADIREGQGSPAFYPKADYITLPRFKDFNSGDAYYAAALHELTHWSGHSSRLNRDMQSRFKDANLYAFEEMVAELGAAFMCAEFGFSNEALNHAGYLQHWIKLLKDDVKAFLSAASRAQAAVDYLKRLALTERPASGGVSPYGKAGDFVVQKSADCWASLPVNRHTVRKSFSYEIVQGDCDMRVGIYARVSTLGKGQTTENQLRELREWCQRAGHEIVQEYVEHEFRPGRDEQTQGAGCVIDRRGKTSI